MLMSVGRDEAHAASATLKAAWSIVVGVPPPKPPWPRCPLGPLGPLGSTCPLGPFGPVAPEGRPPKP